MLKNTFHLEQSARRKRMPDSFALIPKLHEVVVHIQKEGLTAWWCLNDAMQLNSATETSTYEFI